MKQKKVLAHIKSLNGKLDYITILKKYAFLGKVIENKYICRYKNIKCLVIFNNQNEEFYVDDINSILG